MSIHVKEGAVQGLREISDEEKLAWYRENIGGPEKYHHYDVDGATGENIGEPRPWTEEEWSAFILKHQPHPDKYNYDLSYIGKRREEYPDETDQMAAIWSALKALRASGADVGQDASDMLDLFETIKKKYPKPAGL